MPIEKSILGRAKAVDLGGEYSEDDDAGRTMDLINDGGSNVDCYVWCRACP